MVSDDGTLNFRHLVACVLILCHLSCVYYYSIIARGAPLTPVEAPLYYLFKLVMSVSSEHSHPSKIGMVVRVKHCMDLLAQSVYQASRVCEGPWEGSEGHISARRRQSPSSAS
jgi:hypothetical protein